MAVFDTLVFDSLVFDTDAVEQISGRGFYYPPKSPQELVRELEQAEREAKIAIAEIEQLQEQQDDLAAYPFEPDLLAQQELALQLLLQREAELQILLQTRLAQIRRQRNALLVLIMACPLSTIQ